MLLTQLETDEVSTSSLHCYFSLMPHFSAVAVHLFLNCLNYLNIVSCFMYILVRSEVQCHVVAAGNS